MARVKVYVPTFRRHTMLPRAIRSLQEQTFTDWRCEVHNDDPEDGFPAAHVAGLQDDRIVVVNHSQRLGGAATMNAFYAPVQEEFVSILEDDNWWEPEFLHEMISAAAKHQDVTVFWSNMKIWREEPDGSFTFTGRTVNAESGLSACEEFWWPNKRQIMGAVHSNGACLIRSRPGGDYRIPAVPFATIEMFRERMFPQPLMLLRRPLANFSVTMATERAGDGMAYGEATAVLAATFFCEAHWPEEKLREVYESSRRKIPPSTNILLNAAMLEPKARLFFKLATWREIVRWLAGLARRPKLLWRLLRSRRIHPDWWTFMQIHTAARFQEARLRVPGLR